jgi:RNA polymerase sigma factor (TIGR02999 family)
VPSLLEAQTNANLAHAICKFLAKLQDWERKPSDPPGLPLLQIDSMSRIILPVESGLWTRPSQQMCPASSARVSELLVHWGHGDHAALEALIPLVYDELRRLARHHLRRERPNHTLQSAALVHEAYLRLVDQELPQWQNRAHFFGVAAQLMRHILVDHARRRRAAKRGAGAPRLTLDPTIALAQEQEVNLVVLDDALNRLASLDPQQSRIVELRFFGGLSIAETAVALGISPATVKREWATARAWLQREMNKDPRQ